MTNDRFTALAPLLGRITLAAALAITPALAAATATYSSAARSSFTLLTPGPLTSVVDHLPDEGSSTAGAALASIDLALSSPDGVHPASIHSAVSGSAAAPPLSTSSAFVQRGHHFVVDRSSPTGPLPTVTLDFSFSIEWAIALALDLPGSEIATGGAYFAISGFEDGIDSIAIDPGMPGEMVSDGPGLHRWQFNPKELLLAGPPVGSGDSLVVTGSITVLSGMVGAFSVITDVAGSAGARPLPAPAPAWLLLAGAGALWLRRRRPQPSRRPASQAW